MAHLKHGSLLRKSCSISDNGGWPKNQDFSRKIDTADLKELTQQRSNLKDTTIDNGATYTPLKYLTRVWQAQASPGLEASLHRGIAFLLRSQYNNGGWPQRPRSSGYGLHITYNDGAMIGVMSFLRDLEKDPITFLKRTKSPRSLPHLISALIASSKPKSISIENLPFGVPSMMLRPSCLLKPAHTNILPSAVRKCRYREVSHGDSRTL